MTISSSERDADGRVGDVEGVQAQVADAHVDQVDDVPEREPVDEVADGAAEQQAERDASAARRRGRPARHSRPR